MMIISGMSIGWLGLGLFGIGALFSMLELLRGAGVLQFRSEGFVYKTILKTHRIRWGDVEGFDLSHLGRKEVVVCSLKNGSRVLITEKFGENPKDLLRIFDKAKQSR
jgi:hypothetical protein